MSWYAGHVARMPCWLHTLVTSPKLSNPQRNKNLLPTAAAATTSSSSNPWFQCLGPRPPILKSEVPQARAEKPQKLMAAARQRLRLRANNQAERAEAQRRAPAAPAASLPSFSDCAKSNRSEMSSRVGRRSCCNRTSIGRQVGSCHSCVLTPKPTENGQPSPTIKLFMDI